MRWIGLRAKLFAYPPVAGEPWKAVCLISPMAWDRFFWCPMKKSVENYRAVLSRSHFHCFQLGLCVAGSIPPTDNSIVVDWLVGLGTELRMAVSSACAAPLRLAICLYELRRFLAECI